MSDLVTIEEVKAALGIPHDDLDGLLGLLITAGSEMVIRHLGEQADAILTLDSGGDLTTGSVVPKTVTAATLYLVGVLFRNPDGDPDGNFTRGDLPAPVTAMLYPLRDPTIA